MSNYINWDNHALRHECEKLSAELDGKDDAIESLSIQLESKEKRMEALYSDLEEMHQRFNADFT